MVIPASWSSSSGKAPANFARFRSNRPATGSARAHLPRRAWTIRTGSRVSTLRNTAPNLLPALIAFRDHPVGAPGRRRARHRRRPALGPKPLDARIGEHIADAVLAEGA